MTSPPPPLRIASLLPSTTEIACALGLREQLVGRSHECDFPAGVEALPILTEPKLDAGAPSRAIDDRVRQLVSEGLSVYRVDPDALRDLAPTHILTQDHCEVCAASLGDVEEALREFTGARPEVLSLSPMTLGDAFADVNRVAQALGLGDRGAEVTAALSLRITEVAETVGAAGRRPRVALIEWIEPLMAAGNWMPELVSLAGGTAVFGQAGAHSPWIDFAQLEAADAEVIIVLPCGFDVARTRAELPPLLAQPGWAALPAVTSGRVYLADGHQFFNRPGPRLADSTEILAELIHPELVPPKHRGSAWEPL